MFCPNLLGITLDVQSVNFKILSNLVVLGKLAKLIISFFNEKK